MSSGVFQARRQLGEKASFGLNWRETTATMVEAGEREWVSGLGIGVSSRGSNLLGKLNSSRCLFQLPVGFQRRGTAR